ncbi:MAG: hypothetical protein WCD35_13910 [Mycobacteriales bacterium]
MRLADLFGLARQLSLDTHGVLTAGQLRLAGADPDTVKSAIARHWQRPVRGVYVDHRGPLTPEALAHVAAKHAGPGAVITGLVAARVHGLRWVPDHPGVMVLIEPHLRRRSSEGLVLVRRCAGVRDLATTTWAGLPLAPVPQVVVDASRQVLAVRRAFIGRAPTRRQRDWFDRTCLRDIRGLVLGAVADKRCTTEQLLELVDGGAVRDSALLRRACLDAARGAASPPEAELVDDLLGYGIPFHCNVAVWMDGVLLGVADVWLVGTGVGGELDSREAHEAEHLLDATLQRHGRFSSAGLELCHVTPARYRANPAAFHQQLFTAVASRRARELGDPAGLKLVPRGPLLQGRPRAPS